MFFYPRVSLFSSSVVSFRLFCLCALFGEKCQINRNVTSRIGGLLLYLLIEVPSCLSVWRLLLTSDVFFESESAFFSSECYRQQRSVRVKLNVGLYTEFLLPPTITKLVIHLIINPASFFQRIHSAHDSFPLKYQASQPHMQSTLLSVCWMLKLAHFCKLFIFINNYTWWQKFNCFISAWDPDEL